MSINNGFGIRWMKQVAILVVVCTLLGSAATAQSNANKILDDAAVTELLDQLAEGLNAIVQNDQQVDAIADRWNAREDLDNKTRAQILPLLFADVQFVIKDPAIRTKIWNTWNPRPPVATVPKKPAPTPAPTGSASNAPFLPNWGGAELAPEANEGLKLLISRAHEMAAKNMPIWKALFAVQALNRLGETQVYDPYTFAGYMYTNKDATPLDAFLLALEGMAAFEETYGVKATTDDMNNMKLLMQLTVNCEKLTTPAECQTVREKLKERGLKEVERAIQDLKYYQWALDPKNADKVMGAFLARLFGYYQTMETYDPYKEEAKCREAGGDEMACIKATFYGMAAFSFFGKHDDPGPHLDEQSANLTTKWLKERLANFKCNVWKPTPGGPAKSVCTELVHK